MAITMRTVRSLFHRRPRPVEIDLNGSDDGNPADTTSSARGTALGLIETKPRALSAADTGRSMDEVMHLVRKIGDHLDRQTERTDQLVGLMDNVPQALEALPEINRQNARLLEALHEHLGQTKRREEALNSTLSTITETTGRQTDVLGLIQQQLDVNNSSSAQFTDALGDLRHALTDLATSNQRSTGVLERISAAAVERESELAASLARTQRWTLAAIICCGLASMAALGVAVMAMVA
ncbi:MAG: hypothetical protein HKO59_15015 [Phycisphaerales bacterium]|nr:hypothetical protein [Phycisphaerae bacterium]NNF43156.1 hypothetical protein [Phycisphaerales bacterium]NNM27270.1 hypothetical protein [Phycisphaerales bacterium]